MRGAIPLKPELRYWRKSAAAKPRIPKTTIKAARIKDSENGASW